MKRSSSSPSSLARAVAILLVIVCCCSLLPFPCSAICKGTQPHVSSRLLVHIICKWMPVLTYVVMASGSGHAFGDFGEGARGAPGVGGNQFEQGGREGGPGMGGNQFDQGGGEAGPWGGGNHVYQGGGMGGGNQVGRTPPAPRGKTPRNHR
uniref:Uncharacterized protein n=1 Tax=Aegilops tauschii subsp. strangulata TaxID=200361 RepID=A0A453DP53_AEGTS